MVSVGALGWVELALVPSLNTTMTPLVDVDRERSPRSPLPALARRIVVLVVDGLGHDHAASLSGLAPLRREGAFRKLLADFPTFTSPAVTTMVTGLGPRDSGMRVNGPVAGTPSLDSVLRAAWDDGVFVRVRPRTFTPFAELVRPPPQADVVAGRWALAADRAVLPALAPVTNDGRRASEMSWIHINEVDDAGHACGSSCAAYESAAEDAATMARSMAESLDQEQDLLLILSDHGTLADGGHGGDEPGLRQAFALAWGAGIKRGIELDVRPLRDVASTLTVAAGVRTPSSNLGEPMLDLWDLEEREAAARLVEPFDQVMSLGCRLRQVRGCAFVEPVRDGLLSGRASVEDARALHAAVVWDRDREIDVADARARQRRVAIAAPLLALVLVTVARWLRDQAWPATWAGLLAPAPGALVYGLVMILLGYRPTFSAMEGAAVFVPHAAAAALVAGLLGALVGRRAGWGRREAGFTIAVAAGLFGVVAATAGADPRALPSPLFTVLTIQLAPLVAAWTFGAASWVWLARAPRSVGSEREREHVAAGHLP